MSMNQLQDDLDKFLQCPVCLEKIKEPKLLTCQHSFCSNPCLKNMITTKDIRTNLWYISNGKLQKRAGQKISSIKCAICRKSYDFRSINDIPDNLQMKNLLEIRQKQASNYQSHDGKL